MAGIDFFITSEETKIKITNLKAILKNAEFFEPLVGETLVATPAAQFYFERIFGEKTPVGKVINGDYYYLFTAEYAIEVLKQANKSTTLWETLDPETPVILTKKACTIQE